MIETKSSNRGSFRTGSETNGRSSLVRDRRRKVEGQESPDIAICTPEAREGLISSRRQCFPHNVDSRALSAIAVRRRRISFASRVQGSRKPPFFVCAQHRKRDDPQRKRYLRYPYGPLIVPLIYFHTYTQTRNTHTHTRGHIYIAPFFLSLHADVRISNHCYFSFAIKLIKYYGVTILTIENGYDRFIYPFFNEIDFSRTERYRDLFSYNIRKVIIIGPTKKLNIYISILQIY